MTTLKFVDSTTVNVNAQYEELMGMFKTIV